MTLDRYIIVRFLVSFVILFSLLFLFAVAIDLILNLDRFVEVSRRQVGDEASWLTMAWNTCRLMLDFQTPRLFQFYAYLHGLVGIGAMGFTLVQMYRYKELVAIMAAGISLHRVAVPFLLAVFSLSLLQLLNQEFMLPRVAPLLLRDHRHIGRESIEEFAIAFTADGRGNLFQAGGFRPREQTLHNLTIIERNADGITTRRIQAPQATWVPPAEIGSVGHWSFVEGEAMTPPATLGDTVIAPRVPIEMYETDLGPEALTAQRYGQYMAMLSLRQIGGMLDTPGFSDEKTVRALMRHRYARFAGVLLNVLVMWLTLPSFLLREPGNILKNCMASALVSIPAVMGSTLLMMVDLSGIGPALGVFLPVILLGPIALARWTFLKS